MTTYVKMSNHIFSTALVEYMWKIFLFMLQQWWWMLGYLLTDGCG